LTHLILNIRETKRR